MNLKHIERISAELKIPGRQVTSAAQLLADGCTIPFIARYRKEVTDCLDEVALTDIRDRLKQLGELDERRAAILQSLAEHGHLTPELQAKVEAAETMNELEDIYLPYRPKRRTRATVAKEKGLEPLAQLIFEQGNHDPGQEALAFVNPEKQVNSVEEALSGARDIIAEWVSENQDARASLRDMFAAKAILKSKVVEEKQEAGAKYKDYFEWQEPAAVAPSHRILAMLRGEKEEFLHLYLLVNESDACDLLEQIFLKSENACGEQVRRAIIDSFNRLLGPAMERELFQELKTRADLEAIRVFADNLRELLLSSPLGSKRTLAIDPGFRTGCKIVCLDAQGKMLNNDLIYLHAEEPAKQKIRALCERFEIEAVAIGNGTASRETEALVRSAGLPSNVVVVQVNESGASIYSASEVAREEFPDHDITVRGAVSIGRRLMDPLAELVKLDPKSIGVGQYQHDVEQTMLKESLDDVVVSCVNNVGVEVNTASKQLLTYVSGLGPQLADNIVKYRDEHGPFKSRKELREVPRLGPKAFEQSAGFLRIRGSKNPLDASAVHPESYPVVEQMAKDNGCSVSDLMAQENLRRSLDLQKYVKENVGLPTLTDIVSELAKPGRDPRKAFEIFSFDESVHKLEDLRPGMKLPGIVTNVTAFGAFVDIGVHQDGLVHISQLADRFVKNPADVVKVHQKVRVTVVEVDLARKRIALSMRSNAIANATGGSAATNASGAPGASTPGGTTGRTGPSGPSGKPGTSGASKPTGGVSKAGSGNKSETNPSGGFFSSRINAAKGGKPASN